MSAARGGHLPDRLSMLNQRLDKRFSVQLSAPDLLPDPDVDLGHLKGLLVQETEDRPHGKRSDMRSQLQALERAFSGRSELELLHALSISYLRRLTPHTKKSWDIFRRIWVEQSDFMIQSLPVRWLLSALQTFYDHSDDAGEKIAGGIGFTYGNMIKIYETEHNAKSKAATPKVRQYKNKSVPTMFGFKPGDDILININVLVLDAATKGGLAAAPLLRLLEVVADSQTIFQRTDALQRVPEFSDHPSFTLSFDGRP